MADAGVEQIDYRGHSIAITPVNAGFSAMILYKDQQVSTGVIEGEANEDCLLRAKNVVDDIWWRVERGRPKVVIDRVSIERANNSATNHIESYLKVADKLTKDPDKKVRLEKQECKSCYYIFHSRMGGAAMTTCECGICSTSMTFGSTAVDKICKPCAKENQLCVRCGADIGLVNRRTRPLFDNKERS